MKLGILRNMALMGSALAVVVACGGGSGSGSGSGAPVVSYGPITQFGSVFVNDKEYSTTTSTVKKDGQDGAGENEVDADGNNLHRGLKKGMVVKVEGDNDGTKGEAAHIEYKSNVRGPITSIVANPDGSASAVAVVLGQKVIIDSQTWVETLTVPNSETQGALTIGANTLTIGLNTFATGNVVEVSGLPGLNGAIQATRFEKISETIQAGAVFEVKGTVAAGSLNTAARTFRIGDLTVSYSTASQEEGGITDGAFVEAKGTTPDGGFTLVASKAEVSDDHLGVTDAVKAEVQGLVTAVTSQGFTVGTQPVVTTSSTIYEHGNSAGVILGARVEVEGTLSGGTLTATKVSFH